jgi:uncharacterized protein (DUF697 family)
MTTHSSDAASVAGSKAASRQLDLGMLRDAIAHVNGAAFKDGTWFKKLIADHVKKHQAAVQAATWDAAYPGLDAEARAEKHILQVAIKASAAGALASLGASTGEVLSLVTEGLGAPVGVPAAMLSMGLEATYTALLQVDLACDLASIHGVPFDPDDAGEIATLFAVALEVEMKQKAKETGPDGGPEKTEAEGLTARLMDLEEGEVATRIGRKLLEEAVMRNIVPFVGVAISARWNYVATQLLGSKANRYIRYRRAMRRAFARVDCGPHVDPMLLIEGAWLISTSDGEPTHEEVMAIALLAEALGRGAKLDIAAARVDDEDAWLDRLAATLPESHGSILETLYLIAATDRELQSAERRILRRVGKALGREVDFARVEQICRHFADGDDLPAQAHEGGRAPGPAAS